VFLILDCRLRIDKPRYAAGAVFFGVWKNVNVPGQKMKEILHMTIFILFLFYFLFFKQRGRTERKEDHQPRAEKQSPSQASQPEKSKLHVSFVKAPSGRSLSPANLSNQTFCLKTPSDQKFSAVY
jgi:hypothetical protein